MAPRTFLTIIAATLLASCSNPLDVLGPRDKPILAREDWNQITVTYWVYTHRSPTQIKRTFTVSNPETIAGLKPSLRVKKTSGLSIGTDDQLSFRKDGDELWHGSFCFEDTLHLSLTKDAWRSYSFVTSDERFFNALRELCARNERKHHPEATIKHIKLRSNLSYDYPKLGSRP